RRPAPAAKSVPPGPMSTAVDRSMVWTDRAVSRGFLLRIRAATAAEWGAAADVPKNRQNGGHCGNPPAFEIDTPSNAAISGFARLSIAGTVIVTGPREL